MPQIYFLRGGPTDGHSQSVPSWKLKWGEVPQWDVPSGLLANVLHSYRGSRLYHGEPVVELYYFGARKKEEVRA